MLAPINAEWQVISQVNTSPCFPLCDSSGSKAIGVTPGKQFSFFKLHCLRPKIQRQVTACSCSLHTEALWADFFALDCTPQKKKEKNEDT